MNFVNFIVWLSAGAAIGWFASRLVEPERRSSKVSIPLNEGDV